MQQAESALHAAERVLIIGCSGSGKSTLARKLSGMFQLPYISMDRDVFWLPGWAQRPRAKALDIIEGWSRSRDGSWMERAPAHCRCDCRVRTLFYGCGRRAVFLFTASSVDG